MICKMPLFESQTGNVATLKMLRSLEMTFSKLQIFPTNASELISLIEHRMQAEGKIS